MIKKGLISAVLAMTCLVTACGSQTAAPQNEAKQTANAQQDVGEQPPQEASDTAVTEQASEAAQTHDYEEDARHDRSDHEPFSAVLHYDACNDRRKSCRGSCDLDAASA